MSALPLTIKERALWKRLISLYPPGGLIQMIDYWMNSPKTRRPQDFTSFYSMATDIYKQIEEKDYTWE